jgi:adhesin/invasin
MFQSTQYARRMVGPFLSVAVLLVSACKKDAVTSPPAVAAALAPSGQSNAQVGAVGKTLAIPVQVLVTDASGNPIPSMTVTWTLVSGGGQVSLTADTVFASSVTAITNSVGVASVQWQLGTTVGTDSLAATVSAGPSTTFIATAQAGAVASLVVQQGNGQTVTMDSTTAPIVVQALDQYGNPVAGVTIAWLDPNGGTLSTSTGVTDSNGLASVQLTTAPGIPAYTVVAEVAAQPAIEATATVTAQ